MSSYVEPDLDEENNGLWYTSITAAEEVRRNFHFPNLDRLLEEANAATFHFVPPVWRFPVPDFLRIRSNSFPQHRTNQARKPLQDLKGQR